MNHPTWASLMRLSIQLSRSQKSVLQGAYIGLTKLFSHSKSHLPKGNMEYLTINVLPIKS